MSVAQVALVCVGAAMVCAMLRLQRPEIAFAVALGAGVWALAAVSGDLAGIVGAMEALAERAGGADAGLDVILKAAGIALIAEFAGQLCRDAGESALAGRIALAARVALLGLSMPLVNRLMEMMAGMLA